MAHIWSPKINFSEISPLFVALDQQFRTKRTLLSLNGSMWICRLLGCCIWLTIDMTAQEWSEKTITPWVWILTVYYPFFEITNRVSRLLFGSLVLQRKDTLFVSMLTTLCLIYPNWYYAEWILHPYFFISKHPNFDIETDKEDWIAYVSSKLSEETKKPRGKIVDVEIEKRRSIYFYHEDEEYMKVTMQFPGDVPTCRSLLSVHIIGLVHLIERNPSFRI